MRAAREPGLDDTPLWVCNQDYSQHTVGPIGPAGFIHSCKLSFRQEKLSNILTFLKQYLEENFMYCDFKIQ